MRVCLIHEDDVLFPHVPDHIIPIKHRGPTILENLAWSCSVCNHLKGSDLSSVDIESGRIVRLFHPRKDKWNRHFRWRGGHIVPLTAIGRVTELLQLNHPQIVETREALIAVGRFPHA